MSDEGRGIPEYFLCYSRQQRDLAERIEAKLAARRRRGELVIWRDRRGLEVWEEFSPKIHEVIDRAAGAVVVVSDAWFASDYVQEWEWPWIQRRRASDPTFAIFPVAYEQLDADDPLRAHNFVNDLREEVLVGCPDDVRDSVLTRLSDQVGLHCRRVREATPAVTAEIGSGSVESIEPAQTALRPTQELRPGLHHVPALPQDFVPPAELDSLCDRVLAAAVTGITGLHGEGGTGKTVLAAALVRRLACRFPGGVHWVTVGEHATTEDVRRLQGDLLASLGAGGPAPRDLNDGKGLLRQALAGRKALVVVDDVWHPWQGRAFEVVHPAGDERLVLTTRFSEALPEAADTTEMSRLGLAEATTFLRRFPAGLPPVAEDLSRVLDCAGGLRLALAVLGSTAAAEGSWEAVLAGLDGLTRRFGRGDDASSAHQALHVALERLPAEDRARAWALRAFPADAAVPVSLLARLWELPGESAAGVVGHLAERKVVTTVGGAVEVHDHVHDFLALEAPGDPMALHLRLFELAEALAADGWGSLATAEPYLWDRFVWHAVRAGLNRSRLRGIVSDTAWLAARIQRQGAMAAEQDIGLIGDSLALDPEDPLRRLQRVLRHGGLFDAISDTEGLAFSLECWADALGIDRRHPKRLHAGTLSVPAAALTRTLRGHRAAVFGVVFDSTGARLATTSFDGTARLWDTTTGQTLTTLTGHTSRVLGVAFDPTGARLATTSSDGTARLWDTTTGQTLTTLTGHTSGVWGVAFDPTGARLATTSSDGTARIWDTTTGQTLTTLTGHTTAVDGVAFDPTGTRLATTSEDGTARIWDVGSKNGDCRLILALACCGCVAWHEDLIAFATGMTWAIVELPQ